MDPQGDEASDVEVGSSSSNPPASTAGASQAEAGTPMNDGEDVQIPQARLETLDEEDQGPPPPPQFLGNEMKEKGDMAPTKVAKGALETMNDTEGLPLSNLELDEEAGMDRKTTAKGVPTEIHDNTGPTTPPSFQDNSAAEKPSKKLRRDNDSEDQPDHTQRGDAAPPSLAASRPAGRVERVPRGSFLRRLAAIPVLSPPRSMLPSGNAGDRDAAADPARPGNVGEPDTAIDIPEATPVEDEAPLAQNDGPVYEATPVRDWKLRHKVLAGVSLLAVAAVLVFIGVRVSRINATGAPPPSDSNSTASNSASNSTYYPDRIKKLCSNEGNSSDQILFKTAESCCEEVFWDYEDECLVNSLGTSHRPSSPPSDSPTISDVPSSPPSESPSSSSVPSSSPVPSTGPTFGPSSIPSMRPTTQLQSSAMRLATSEDVAEHSSTENVAFQGDTAVIGAPLNDSWRGAVFVLNRDESGWSQLAKLEAPDRELGDRFGWSVAIDGDTIVVGADGDDSDKGSVHVFTKINGSWQHQARLVAPDREAGADDAVFGYSVGIHQDRVVIGANWEDSIGIEAGAAYVFVRNETRWALESKLLAPAGGAYDYFGTSVGIFNDAIVVGARFDAAHVYTRTSGGAWEHRARLSSPDGASHDLFGWSVGIHDNRVIVGDPRGYSGGLSAGASSVFAVDGSAWTLEAKLLAPDGAAGYEFGKSVGIFEGTAVVGSSWGNDNLEYSVSAHIFELAQGDWSHRAKVLAPDVAANDYFGNSVAVHNGTVIAHSSASGKTFAFSE